MRQKIKTYSNGLNVLTEGNLDLAYIGEEMTDEVDITELPKKQKELLRKNLNNLTLKKYKDRIEVKEKKSGKILLEIKKEAKK